MTMTTSNPMHCFHSSEAVFAASVLIVAALFAINSFAAGGGAEPSVEDAPFNVEDPWLKRLQGLTYDQESRLVRYRVWIMEWTRKPASFITPRQRRW